MFTYNKAVFKVKVAVEGNIEMFSFVFHGHFLPQYSEHVIFSAYFYLRVSISHKHLNGLAQITYYENNYFITIS